MYLHSVIFFPSSSCCLRLPGNRFVAAVSDGLWGNGAACGRRYRIRCLRVDQRRLADTNHSSEGGRFLSRNTMPIYHRSLQSDCHINGEERNQLLCHSVT